MFQFGADPEIFLRKNGKPVSAHGLIEGTKKEPFPTPLGAYQVDGMAVEFNIKPAQQYDFEAFNLNIASTLRDLNAAVGKDYRFAKHVTVQDFDPAYLEEQPDEAKELGCDPDYCAYTGEINPVPDGTRNFRTAAGHVHIGWGADIPPLNQDHMEICCQFVKALDATVGVYMTYIDREPRRRELYGKAGSFRPKSYGVEYRTPSNEWIWNRSRRILMHALLQNAITYNTSYAGNYNVMTNGFLNTEEQVRELINSGDWRTAEKILDAKWFGADWLKVKKEMDRG